MGSKTSIQVTATTYFSIKLTINNFAVWHRQVESTLIGLDRDTYMSNDQQIPKQFLDDKDNSKPNLEYLFLYHQDQTIISAILGCCLDSIQPLISSATTTNEAWKQLNANFASESRSRVISVKSKLVKNPKGAHSIAEYLQDMRATVEDLELD